MESTEQVLEIPAMQSPKAAPKPTRRHRDATNMPNRQYRAFMLIPTANVKNDDIDIAPCTIYDMESRDPTGYGSRNVPLNDAAFMDIRKPMLTRVARMIDGSALG